jgi:lysine 2,3-aminomutase
VSANPNRASRAADLSSLDDLIAAGFVDQHEQQDLEPVTARYPVALTAEMAAQIDPADPNDPIARQFIPSRQELTRDAIENDDPIGDHAHSPVKGLVHRHPDRVLLKPLHVCPVYCRFCFRRESVGPQGDGSLSERELGAALAYVAAHPQISEIIVTGGDPFMLSPRRIAGLAKAADGLAHVKVLRWHTRVPLVDPDRVNAALIEAAQTFGRALYVAVHGNHPREFTPSGRGALARLADAGIPLLSQTVLLKGINDDADVMADLMRAFVENRVKPYYLHHGDLAPGTARFRTTIAEGQALMRLLRQRLSGLAMPTYVIDLPGGHGKVPVGPKYLEDGVVIDPQGGRHTYPPTAPAG